VTLAPVLDRVAELFEAQLAAKDQTIAAKEEVIGALRRELEVLRSQPVPAPVAPPGDTPAPADEPAPLPPLVVPRLWDDATGTPINMPADESPSTHEPLPAALLPPADEPAGETPAGRVGPWGWLRRWLDRLEGYR
jgi:hypothetical protein